MKKKVFICSTSFDLIDTRAEISQALLNWGYEPKFFESPDFPVKKGLHSHDVCLDAIKECDIFLLIIGSRYGGIYQGKKYPEMNELSITRAETRVALDKGLEFRTFIRNNIWNERATYKSNLKSNIKINPFHADDIKVFEFIDEIVHRVRDNWIYQFENSVEFKEKLEKMLVPESIVTPLIENEDIKIEFVLSHENRKNNLIQNGEEILFLNSKSTRGPAECTIYANTVNRFYEKAYKLETYIQGMTLAELEKIIRIYYSTFRYRHYVSAFGINQEACSWFGFGPLNFLKALKMQDIRYAEMKNNNEYIHHNEAATFIDEMSDAIFYISSQPSKKRKQDDLVTLDRVNIGFIFSKNPYNNIYHDFFEKIGSIPGFVDEINEPPTVLKKMDHTITEEGYIIDDPNEEFGGWVCGIFCNNVTNSKLTEINNEKIIVNFNHFHEMKDICKYKILSVHATTLHTVGFSTIIVNYKGDWSII